MTTAAQTRDLDGEEIEDADIDARSGPTFEEIQRRSSEAAMLREPRVQVEFDPETGSYRLGVAASD